MATIQLSSGMMNQISGSFSAMTGSFDKLSSNASAMIKQFWQIDSGITDISAAQTKLQAVVDRQTSEKESAGLLDDSVDSFIETSILADSRSSDTITSMKNAFYEQYSYLKPDCEKTYWEKFKEAVSDAVQWCKDTISFIIDYIPLVLDKIMDFMEHEFFNLAGKLIHSKIFQIIVKEVVGLFTRLGGMKAIKFLAETGTKIALWCRKHPYLSSLIPGLSLLGKLAPKFFDIFLNADMDDNGVYHIRPDCWQQYTQYTTGYDDVFRSAVNGATGGELTVDAHQSRIFWVDLDDDGIREKGEDFIIWSWKGDYTNLGAGSETGIYRVMDAEYNEDGSYKMSEQNTDEYAYIYAEVDRQYEVDMSLSLYHDADGKKNYSNLVFDYNPEEGQWWVNGFNPLYQNVKAEDLRAVTTLNFDSWEDKELAHKFYDAIKSENTAKNRREWFYDDENLTVTLDWKG